MIEFISITVLTFAMALLTLGVTTMLLERGRGRQQGIALAAVGLLTGAGYAFLGSRFALKLFGRLLVRVDLPALMATTLIYTAGVLLGSALAGGLFLWASGRFRDRVERIVLAFVLLGVLVALVATFLAVVLSSS
ncbi:MAG: hypothetical protein PVF04_05525 [Anaerolineae bacterium]|jgi:hypothetical protein